jgi:hypothetical protein
MGGLIEQAVGELVGFGDVFVGDEDRAGPGK